ncbi:hypothetical protein ACFY04_40245 [Streptomyces sp. NPDC001549]|uniref:hypothetical protein n=1 Tax=Streptomyces sp. NPDC001549 TaxID=3364586 RepID=UPI003678DC09
MKSVIAAIDPVAPDNALKCSMHDKTSPNCSGPVVADVTFDDAGSTGNHWNVCQWWLDNTPEAQQF